MVPINRNNTPDFLDLPELINAQKEINVFYENREAEMVSGIDIPRKLERDILSKILLASDSPFNRKCSYCESRVDIKNGIVDRFRPRGGARHQNGTFSSESYFWLIYHWNNLFLCCKECNQYKGSQFPIEGHRAKAFSFENDLLSENPLLIDPTIDAPQDHLQFKPNGTVSPLDLKGEMTIKVLHLNRNKLVSARKSAIQEFLIVHEQSTKAALADKPLQLAMLEIEKYFQQSSTIPHSGTIKNLIHDQELSPEDFS